MKSNHLGDIYLGYYLSQFTVTYAISLVLHATIPPPRPLFHHFPRAFVILPDWLRDFPGKPFPWDSRSDRNRSRGLLHPSRYTHPRLRSLPKLGPPSLSLSLSPVSSISTLPSRCPRHCNEEISAEASPMESPMNFVLPSPGKGATPGRSFPVFHADRYRWSMA